MAATLVVGKLDEISRAIGGLEASTTGLRASFDKHCLDDENRHSENIAVQREISESVRKLTEAMTASRFKVAGAASVIMVLFAFLGWLIQTFVVSLIQGAWKLLH